jgi:hypothetical protein
LDSVLKEPEKAPKPESKDQTDGSADEGEVFYCPVHETPFVQGKYGIQHRIEGTNEWCSPAKLIVGIVNEYNLNREDVNASLKTRYGITISKSDLEHYEYIKTLAEGGHYATQETEVDGDSLTLTPPDGSVQIPDSEEQVGLWPN